MFCLSECNIIWCDYIISFVQMPYSFGPSKIKPENIIWYLYAHSRSLALIVIVIYCDLQFPHWWEVHEIRGRKEVDIMIITVRYTENISDINRKYELLVENWFEKVFLEVTKRGGLWRGVTRAASKSARYEVDGHPDQLYPPPRAP